jgi:hypothetical protein
MADAISPSPPSSPAAPSAAPLLEAYLELRYGVARPRTYPIAEAGFLIGTVLGCDLRLPGADLPPVLCLIARRREGVGIRKLVATQPVLVNGHSVSQMLLADGDRITVGPVELLVHAPTLAVSADAEPSRFQAELVARSRELEAAQRHLDAQVGELETDRILWYNRRDEIEQETRQLRDEQQRQADGSADLQRRTETVQREQEELTRQQAELVAGQQQLQAAREELSGIRQQHYERYRARRDRLAGLEEAVRRAAAKVQEGKRQLDVDVQKDAHEREQETQRRADLERRALEVAQVRKALDDQQRRLDERKREIEDKSTNLQAEFQARENQLAQDRRALQQQEAQHQADLVRLDRWTAALEEREQQLHTRAQEIDARHEELQRDSRDLEQQSRQLEEWHAKLGGQAEQIAKQHADLEVRGDDVGKRGAALEVQQGMLASLRTRLERMQEEARRQEQLLLEQRSRQEKDEAALQQRMQDLDRLRAELGEQRRQCEADRRQYEERSSHLEAAAAQTRQAHDRVLAHEDTLRERAAVLDASATEQAKQARLLEARSRQVDELQERLTADRNSLRDRETALAQAEAAREALQEQLRRRSEELAERQRTLADRDREHAESLETLAAAGLQLDEKAAGMAERQSELSRRENQLTQQTRRLQAAGRAFGRARKAQAVKRIQWQTEQQEAAVAAAYTREELQFLRRDLFALQRDMPDWEMLNRAAADNLARAREHLRGHLSEIHAYVHQSQEDLGVLRAHVQAESDQARQQTLALHHAREEHRLAVAGFRQQLIDWQGQVAGMRQALSQDESRLERRQAEVDQQARQVDATSARLAQQAEQLLTQEREVAERRTEVDRHLSDMREWYRRKLRELTARYSEVVPQPTFATPPVSGGVSPAEPVPPTILTMTPETDPGDRQLGDLLRSLELVDADTLAALLVEARKQRQSLRQVLLAGGTVTLYQLALIEAGNLDALVMGPVRVMDRLRVGARETIYRVFDPRRSPDKPSAAAGYAVLRHLAEAEMQNAVHPDEFRQRFGAAARVQHPHLAATLEVLEINGRPAVLQEWLSGLPATEWPALVNVSGVWYRLLCQAALGLHTAHQAGLMHGHLNPGQMLLTADGTLKWCGFGEPGWLADRATEDAPTTEEVGSHTDLAALGRMASAWAALRSGGRQKGKARELAEALQAIRQRLTATAPGEGYTTAAELLADLEGVGADVPPNPEAWDRLVRYVQENGSDRSWRQSA